MRKSTTHRGYTHLPGKFRAILFDLDGTLADTAPDLLFALNRVITEEGSNVPLLSPDQFIPLVSRGGRAMVRRGFGIEPEHPDFPRLFQRFLDIYRDNIAHHTRLFPGMEAVLARIEARGMRWGVVTNKSGWLTDPLLAALGLTHRAACIVSRDTTLHPKPYPDSLLFACRKIGTIPRDCLYIGDTATDIEAGLRAGAHTAVALFGYIPSGEEPERWGADHVFSSPQAIFHWLGNLP